ncbi:MAG: ABC transporter ATP-binding protein [Candidatus Eutrophobiaceae bacterium]
MRRTSTGQAQMGMIESQDKIVIENLCVDIEGQRIIEGISLRLGIAKIGCLLGPSGCGKTTLLRAIAGFEVPAAGNIWVDGERISFPGYVSPAEKRKTGMVFQDYALFPHLNVAKNILFGLRRRDAAWRQRRLRHLLELLELENLAHKHPHSLSGGQQQRVALARALAPKPSLLLLDEPFSNLDVELREQLVVQVREVLRQEGITSLMVSHNQQEAFAMADYVGVIDAGRLLQWGSAFDLYHKPCRVEVASFIGEGVFIPGHVVDDRTVYTALGNIHGMVPAQFIPKSEVRVLLRPDDILHDDNSSMRLKVKAKAFRGAAFLYTLELNDCTQILSLVPSHHDHPIGEPIGIRLEIDHLVVFPKI